MEFASIRTTNLRNDRHFQFYTEVASLILDTSPEALKIGPLYEDFRAAYVRVDEALKIIRRSEHTNDLNRADKARDDIFGAIVQMVSAAQKHYIPELLKPAERLRIVLKTYGNIAQKSRQDQTSATYNILQELQGKYAPDVEALGLTGWVAELKKRNDAYAELIGSRYEESHARTDIVLREARLELDAAYRAITKRIAALVEIEGPGAYEQFIKKHNEIVRINAQARKTGGKKGAGGAEYDEGEEDEYGEETE